MWCDRIILEDKTNNIADHFAFKHHYITSAMDSEALCMILKAIYEKRNITVEMINRKKIALRKRMLFRFSDDQCTEWETVYDGLYPIF